MKKIVVGPKAKGCIDLNKSVEENILNVAKALGKKTTQMTIMTQDRERHNYIIEPARKLRMSNKNVWRWRCSSRYSNLL